MIDQAFRELAGEPASQIITVDPAIRRAAETGQHQLAYDLSRTLLDVTLRDGTIEECDALLVEIAAASTGSTVT